MENSQGSTRVRRYRKSSVPRLRWTPELHDHFVDAVQKLGGKYKATPKRILQMMTTVRGLRISHIKSHLQMYRSAKESTDLNKLIAIKNYHGKKPAADCINFLPLLQVSQGLIEPPTHRKQEKDTFHCQGRRKITQKGEGPFHPDYQGKKGSTANAITRGDDGGIPWANIELAAEANAVNLWGLGSRHTWHAPINLNLTMSSHYISPHFPSAN